MSTKIKIGIIICNRYRRCAGGFDNAEFFGPHVKFASKIGQENQMLLFDPQTSGGLLFAVSHDKVLQCEQEALVAGNIPLWRVGEVISASILEVI